MLLVSSNQRYTEAIEQAQAALDDPRFPFPQSAWRGIGYAYQKLNQPVLIYMRSTDRSKNAFHAGVIDGMRVRGKVTEFHYNWGWYGHKDGWFEFEKQILDFDDHELRKVITFEPLKRRIQR